MNESFKAIEQELDSFIGNERRRYCIGRKTIVNGNGKWIRASKKI